MTGKREGRITRFFEAIKSGEVPESAAILEALYDELKRIARHTPRGRRDTLNTTDLAHEAILRIGLLDGSLLSTVSNRAEFFAAVSRCMRQILIDRARKRNAVKRGGERTREPLDQLLDSALIAFRESYRAELLDLDEALENLREEDSRSHAIAMLRFFCGLTEDEVASCLDVSKSLVQKEWKFAKACLRRRLGEGV